MADTHHTKNQSDAPKAHDLVKPGSTMDTKKAGAAGQGLGGQPGQQGQVQNQAQNQGQIGQQGLSESADVPAPACRNARAGRRVPFRFPAKGRSCRP